MIARGRLLVAVSDVAHERRGLAMGKAVLS